MRTQLALALILGLSAQASAEDKRTGYFGVGIGLSSCATWLENPASEDAGVNWINGIWTGLNATNQVNRFIGEKTDAAGRIAEVKKICLQTPSKRLVDAFYDAYSAFMKAEK